MKKFSLALFLCFMPLLATAENETPTPTPTVPARVSVFSTSTDWESVTGLRLSQYRVEFTPDSKLIKNGLELYFLDGFPCFGQSDRSRIWIGANNKTDNAIQATCLYPPKTVYFAYRNAARNARQDKTTGILECPNQSKSGISVNLSKCTIGKDWKEFR